MNRQFIRLSILYKILEPQVSSYLNHIACRRYWNLEPRAVPVVVANPPLALQRIDRAAALKQ
jgi:hypothetical protein